MRDGMNLVAKEYVAAQDPEDPGTLILSKFAGAAQQLRAALIVNPNDKVEVAEAIRDALQMSQADRITRWRALIEPIREHDVAWVGRRLPQVTSGLLPIRVPRAKACSRRLVIETCRLGVGRKSIRGAASRGVGRTQILAQRTVCALRAARREILGLRRWSIRGRRIAGRRRASVPDN